MSHTQPSPTAGVAPHHAAAHLAAHAQAQAQANGHMSAIPVQGQKGVPSLTTAQKIATLNEQVWLQIGKEYPILYLKLAITDSVSRL